MSSDEKISITANNKYNYYNKYYNKSLNEWVFETHKYLSEKSG